MPLKAVSKLADMILVVPCRRLPEKLTEEAQTPAPEARVPGTESRVQAIKAHIAMT